MSAGKPLKTRDQRELMERIAELSRSDMPLPEGLRAAAKETSSRRLAGQLRALASQLESGARWEEQLVEGNAGELPAHVLGVIRAGIRSGNLGDALDGLIDQDRAYRDVWRHLFTSLVYPVSVFILTALFLVFALIFVVRPMKAIYTDFGTELPMFTQLWIRLADELPGVLMWCAIATVGLLVAVRVVGGRVGWRRFVFGIPIFGPMIHLAGVSQMLRLLQVMLSHNLPLPEALRLTASGASDASMQRVSSWLAEGTENGIPLSKLMDSTPQVPNSIVPIVRWGEENAALGEALRSSYELLEGRMRLTGSSMIVLLGPLLLIFVGAAIGMLAMALLMPLVSLIQNLT